MNDDLFQSLPPLFPAGNAGSQSTWRERRRPELLSLYCREVYGRIPEGIRLTATGPETRALANGGTEKRYVLFTDGFRFPVRLMLPQANRRCPVLLYLLIAGQTEEFIPVGRFLENGCGVALMRSDDIAADEPNAKDTGIFAWLKRQGTPCRDAGALAAWAWGLDQARQCLTGDPGVNGSKISLAGYSRGGKCALWACALYGGYEQCFAVHSGCGGASLFRAIKPGRERIAEITRAFPYWFSPAFSAYGGLERQLQVDQHMLLALCAPATLHVMNADEDPYCDAAAEKLSCELAKPVYRLFGKKICYSLDSGDHRFTPEIWDEILRALTTDRR